MDLAPALPDAAKTPRHQDRALVPVRGRYPAGRQRPAQRRLARGAGAGRVYLPVGDKDTIKDLAGKALATGNFAIKCWITADVDLGLPLPGG
jgi:hypothetical protein